jgi:acyl carrier protein
MNATMTDVATRILQHVENGLDRPVKGPVTLGSHLAHDLQLDSMESVALLAELEDHYGVTLPVQVFQRAQTLGDVAQAVVEVLGRHGGQGT